MESVEALLDNSEEVFRLEIPAAVQEAPVRVFYKEITEKELSAIQADPKAKEIKVKPSDGIRLTDRIYDTWVSYLDLTSEEMTKIDADPKVRHTEIPMPCEYKDDDGKVYSLPPRTRVMKLHKLQIQAWRLAKEGRLGEAQEKEVKKFEEGIPKFMYQCALTYLKYGKGNLN